MEIYFSKLSSRDSEKGKRAGSNSHKMADKKGKESKTKQNKQTEKQKKG